MLVANIKLALKSLRAAGWRSLLTMLGIIIGIVATVTIVGLGEGVRQQVVGHVNKVGADLITVRPGTPLTRNPDGSIRSLNLGYGLGLGAGSLSDLDLQTVKNTKGVGKALPLAFLSGSAKSDNQEYTSGYILGTGSDLPDFLQQKIEFGTFFDTQDSYKFVAVIGKDVAAQLFQENVPIGRTMTIRGQDFIVRGVFEDFSDTPLTLGVDLNAAIFIPYDTARQLAPDSSQLVQIWAQPSQPSQVSVVTKAIDNNLLVAHNAQHDFTVLKQSDSIALGNEIFKLFSGFIGGIAAISLLVGGIGIMNIMLVSVTERTREIGIRKALGATNRQLLQQFLTEALVLSVSGGLIGIGASYAVEYLIRIFTNYTPIITVPILLGAVGVSVLVGILFGIIPAVKAARKDPIDALRNE
jgi:putative ABC transport system permease protein